MNFPAELAAKYFTLGTDPEVFVVDDKSQLLPAFMWLPPKKQAQAVSAYEPFWDGFQAEFSTPAQSCINCLVDAVHFSLERIDKAAKAVNPKARLTISNTFRIKQAVLDETEPEYVALGCMPSLNAYGKRGKCLDNGRELQDRSAGGHLHFGGFAEKEAPAYNQFVKPLDQILGVWAVGVAASFDNPIRRQYYGLAGEHRTPVYGYSHPVIPGRSHGGYDSYDHSKKIPTDFGIEYRTLSNFWLAHPVIMQATWEVARQTMRLALNAPALVDLWATTDDETFDVIQSCNVKQAREILKRNEAMFLWLMNQSFGNLPKILVPDGAEVAQRTLDLSQRGLEAYVKEPDNFAHNWQFGQTWEGNCSNPNTRWSEYKDF